MTVGTRPSYFWKKGEVVILNQQAYLGVAKQHDLLRYFCVDTNETTVALRYGKFSGDGWRPIPLENFPREFRTYLLLLGVV